MFIFLLWSNLKFIEDDWMIIESLFGINIRHIGLIVLILISLAISTCRKFGMVNLF